MNKSGGFIRRTWRGAAALGLAFAAGGLAAVVLDPTLVRARDDGAIEFVTRNAPAAWRETPARPAPVLAYAPVRAVDPFERYATPFAGPQDREPAPRRAPRAALGFGSSGEMSSRRTVCVRMCDGFVFPSSDAGVTGGSGDQLQSCQSACPSATVKLFTLPAGTDNLGEATAADGQRYDRLPMAFAYTRARDAACTCRPDGPGLAARTPLEDRTLRTGDIVVVDGKPRVFTGAGERTQFTLANFRDPAQGGNRLSADARSKVDERLGLSRRASAQKELDRLKAKGRAPAAVVATASAAPSSAAPAAMASTVRVIAGATRVPAR